MSKLDMKAHLKGDVIIIGSGLAGMIGALEVAKKGGSVLLISRAPLGMATCTGWSAGAFCGAFDVSIEEHQKLTLQCGRSINDRELVYELTSKAPGFIKRFFRDYSIDFVKRDPLRYCIEVERGLPGSVIIKSLVKEIRRSDSICSLERVLFTTLLKRGGAVQGAVALSQRGEIYLFEGKSIILASGGYSGIFPRNDNPPGITGMGLVSGALAGASLLHLEFIQFHPLGFAMETLPSFFLSSPYPPTLRLYNQRREDILKKYLPVDTLTLATTQYRDLLSRMMCEESSLGPLYLDLAPLTGEDYQEYPGLRLLKSYRRFKGDRLEVSPITHYTMGGLSVDTSYRTEVKGLYGAGEVIGGLHGANRLGGNALTNCLVSGYRVAEMALEEREEGSGVHLASLKERWETLIGEEKEDMGELKGELGVLVETYLGPIRCATGLETFLKKIGELEERIEGVKVKKERLWELFELRSMVTLSQMIGESALKREESRGAHYRQDYPEESEEVWFGERIYGNKKEMKEYEM